MRFDNRVVVITGAGKGLGAAMARGFTERGGQVVLVARSDESLGASGAAAQAAGGTPLMVKADIATIPGAREVADTAMERFGRIDVLINSAFAAPAKRMLLEMDDAALENWRSNVESGGYPTLLACRFIVPHMVAAGRGAIVNVTSMSSRLGFAGRSDYAAGKAAGHKIAQALADELGPLGIRVNCVAPGHIWSEGLERFYRQQARASGRTYEQVLEQYTGEMALRRVATGEEIANAVLFLASDLASAITGAVLDVNAGHYFTP